MIIPILITIILVVVLLSPFFLGSGGLLQEANSINSVERLKSLKEALLKRYLQDEASFKKGDLSERSWTKRKEYLTNRYVDVSRRSDFLARMKTEPQKTEITKALLLFGFIWLFGAADPALIGQNQAMAQMAPAAGESAPAAATDSTAMTAPQGVMDVKLMPRQMMILREGLDSVYGQVMFVARNNASVPMKAKFRILLPKETVDFSPREGLEAGDVALAQDEGGTPSERGGTDKGSLDEKAFKGLDVEKAFAPGVSMMSIGFKVNAQWGQTMMTLSHPQGVEELNVLLLKGGRLRAESPGLTPDKSEDIDDPQYDYLSLKEPLKPQEILTIRVEGVPEGRSRYVWLGALTGGILLLGGILLTWKSLPKVTSDQKGDMTLLG